MSVPVLDDTETRYQTMLIFGTYAFLDMWSIASRFFDMSTSLVYPSLHHYRFMFPFNVTLHALFEVVRTWHRRYLKHESSLGRERTHFNQIDFDLRENRNAFMKIPVCYWHCS